MSSYQYSDNVAENGNELQQQAYPGLSGIIGNAGEEKVYGNSNSRNKWAKAAGLALAAFAVLALMARNNNSSNELLPAAAALKGSSAQMVDLEGSAKTSVKACTFEECYASNCNWEVAPYTCLFMNGGPHGGCSPTPWYVPATCTTQCDLTSCGKVSIPDDADSCDKACDEEWCATTGERLCGSTAPYQCTEGSSAYGCSNDEALWAFKSSVATCSNCCNAAKCA